MTVFELLLPAFVASLILTGIHAYLGVHVVERGVIFVDLSLAQIAALGTHRRLPRRLRPALGHGVPVLARLHLHRRGGVRVLARAPPHPHPAGGGDRHRLRGVGGGGDPGDVEGDPGDRAPQGDAGREHPVGDLAELGKTALLYALVGAFHYVFRERFLLISMDEEEAERRGWNVRFWDFLFYASFGFVVTSSVASPGCCWSSAS